MAQRTRVLITAPTIIPEEEKKTVDVVTKPPFIFSSACNSFTLKKCLSTLKSTCCCLDFDMNEAPLLPVPSFTAERWPYDGKPRTSKSFLDAEVFRHGAKEITSLVYVFRAFF